jgi:hypothetical protein
MFRRHQHMRPHRPHTVDRAICKDVPFNGRRLIHTCARVIRFFKFEVMHPVARHVCIRACGLSQALIWGFAGSDRHDAATTVGKADI